MPEDPAALIAVVGQQRILLADLLPKVEAKIAEVTKRAGQEIPEAQLEIAKVNLVRGLLAQSIQNKMMREAFLIDQMGTEAADKRAQADAKLTSRARMMFHESQLPDLMKQYETTDRNVLDEKLREKGTSLASQQREFVDMMLGHLYIRDKVDREPKVSISEINDYYQVNRDEFLNPTRARWEQMSVLFDRFATAEEARQAIEAMGREAYFGGNMQAVAREKSQEPFASKGGLHDWTTKGSLASSALDQQIFSIPLNEMSEIIKDTDGLHIVRVLEREEAGVTPLSKVQDEIREKIRAEKIQQSQVEVMEAMHKRIPVWSLFPDDTPGANPLPTSVSRLQ
ncbi:peptidylprolyl isomerase [Rubripirellula lacrimiformis]|uniref:peptidylprolyl isomerase n=1 Tax=Rubripirellula lacrimiformis TaxID=1930273 RepID=UPI001FEBB6FC|nr:peptidyl-prolyl cis-trans isomerase [Rubripirellula lacrimiformis]